MSTLPQLIEEDISAMDRALVELLAKSEASAALVIDKGGFLINQSGQDQLCDTTTLAALSAASYAATQGIASLVGESNFSSIYQQGENVSLVVENIDEHCLLTILFPASVSVGAVKYYARQTIKAIGSQLKKAKQRAPDAGLDLSMLNLADTRSIFNKK